MKNPVNQIELTGNVGQNPQLSTLMNGKTVCNLNIATHESSDDESKSDAQKTTWHKVKAWGVRGERMAQTLHKGNLVNIRGRIQYRDYQDRDGTVKSVAEILAERFELIDLKKAA
jgi:single-strand DNA-binding protein